jgi:hypothetical protein
MSGAAVKDILELLGADVAGPAATKAEAERLLAERSPDIPSSTSISEEANWPMA